MCVIWKENSLCWKQKLANQQYSIWESSVQYPYSFLPFPVLSVCVLFVRYHSIMRLKSFLITFMILSLSNFTSFSIIFYKKKFHKGNVKFLSLVSWWLLVWQVLGYLCALEAMLLSVLTRCGSVQYTPVDDDPSQMTMLQERRPPTPPSPPPPRRWPLDDVQPCSSKYLDPYSVAWWWASSPEAQGTSLFRHPIPQRHTLHLLPRITLDLYVCAYFVS